MDADGRKMNGRKKERRQPGRLNIWKKKIDGAEKKEFVLLFRGVLCGSVATDAKAVGSFPAGITYTH